MFLRDALEMFQRGEGLTVWAEGRNGGFTGLNRAPRRDSREDSSSLPGVARLEVKCLKGLHNLPPRFAPETCFSFIPFAHSSQKRPNHAYTSPEPSPAAGCGDELSFGCGIGRNRFPPSI
jgi:hypothetical protein